MVLSSIKEDLAKVNASREGMIVDSAILHENVKALSSEVASLAAVIKVGNGTQSVLTRLHLVETDLKRVLASCDVMRKDIRDNQEAIRDVSQSVSQAAKTIEKMSAPPPASPKPNTLPVATPEAQDTLLQREIVKGRWAFLSKFLAALTTIAGMVFAWLTQ